MNYIKDVYSYFNDTNSSDKIFKTLKSKVLDDFETYKMYKETFNEKKYKLGKALKTNSPYYELYLEGMDSINEYIKTSSNTDIKNVLDSIVKKMAKDRDNDYAKYYLFRLLIEEEMLPFCIPSNNNMIIESRKLLNYFASINHKKIIAGQHTQTVDQEELGHIKNITGFYPKLVGYELLACSKNINAEKDKECMEEVEANKGTLQVALYDERSILTFTWHMFSPLYGSGKSFYSENTEFDCRKIFEDGSAENKAFYKEMDHMSRVLRHFLDYKKPVLFRPFHEADGTWFWWGKYGVKYAKKLFILMHKYFTQEKGLDNLIWVWNSIGDYPGDEYVDIVSVDVYENVKGNRTFADICKEIREKVSDKKMIALAECDKIPSIDELEKENYPFIYFMTWSKEFCLTEKYNTNKYLKEIYHNKNVIKEK